MSDFQTTWLHLFVITEYCHNQGLQVCLVIAGLPCHSKTALSCHSKTAGQVCRASLLGKTAGQSKFVMAVHRKKFTLISSLIMFDHVWSCLITSDHVWSSFWSCLIMFDQRSAEIVPSLTKGRHSTTNNNKAKCIPGGTLRVLAGKNKTENTSSPYPWAFYYYTALVAKLVARK
jgi:hypothetical protein